MNVGKCPKCETVISRVNFENIDVSGGIGGPTWRGISYKCPSCKTVLGVQIDPIALNSDLIDDLFTRLRKGS